jgi:hypothetical protein
MLDQEAEALAPLAREVAATAGILICSLYDLHTSSISALILECIVP